MAPDSACPRGYAEHIARSRPSMLPSPDASGRKAPPAAMSTLQIPNRKTHPGVGKRAIETRMAHRAVRIESSLCTAHGATLT
eukprot:3682883-Alexandrium_andersonii.AAC.1